MVPNHNIRRITSEERTSSKKSKPRQGRQGLAFIFLSPSWGHGVEGQIGASATDEPGDAALSLPDGDITKASSRRRTKSRHFEPSRLLLVCPIGG